MHLRLPGTYLSSEDFFELHNFRAKKGLGEKMQGAMRVPALLPSKSQLNRDGKICASLGSADPNRNRKLIFFRVSVYTPVGVCETLN